MTLTGRNGYIRKALELGRQLSPQDVDTLRLGRAEVLLGLATEKERPAVAAAVESLEERPEASRLLNRIALRVEHPEDRQVLTRADPLRVYLPEPLPEPPADPQLDRLILDQAGKKAAASAAVEAVRRQLTNGLVELSKLRGKRADTAALRAQLGTLQEDVERARDAEDREAGRLAQLLQIRANRRQAFALAESTKR